MLLFAGERRIGFTSVNERRAVALCQAILSKLQRWRVEEWRVVGVAQPMEFSSRSTPDGCRMTFYSKGSGGALQQDSIIDVAVRRGGRGLFGETAAITLGDSATRRAQQQQVDVLYKLLLHESRAGALGPDCKVAPGIYPSTDAIASRVRKIDAACLYDKKGQYERF